jgi:beta-glucosidase
MIRFRVHLNRVRPALLHITAALAIVFVLASDLGVAADVGIEQRIDALPARMTLAEKIGQMSQSTAMTTPMSPPMREEIRQGKWGSFLNAGGAADRAEAQRIALKESRLGIPLLFGRDVIHGYRTVFPIPLGQAASWDPALIEEAARVAAQEAGAEGIRWVFAPIVDIARDPRWGRIAESPGEDPYVGELVGAAMVRGFQGATLNDVSPVAACVKHFAGYGAAEAGRDYNSAWIPELLLRDVYLPPFRAAVNAGAATVMTSFNTLSGVPATGNSFLLQKILREEWKFDGMVVSDYTAVPEMIAHGYAADARDAAREAVNAGVDMEMVSTTYRDHLPALIASGEVPLPRVDEAVRNILRLKFRLGLFDQPVAAPMESRITPESRTVAQRLAAESAVLLKNERDLLPLADTVGSVAVIGPLVDSLIDQMGTWVMDGRPEDVQTPLAALRRMLGESRVRYAPGLKSSRSTDRSGFAAALDAARKSDVVLLFLGEEAILSGEARSRAFLNLPGAQEDLVREMASLAKPTVGVIMAGRPLTFHQAATQIQAILWTWHPGTMGGPAIADLLFGRAFGKAHRDFPAHSGAGADLLCAPQYRPARERTRIRHSDGQSRRSEGLHLEIHRCRFHARISLRIRSFLHSVWILESGFERVVDPQGRSGDRIGRCHQSRTARRSGSSPTLRSSGSGQRSSARAVAERLSARCTQTGRDAEGGIHVARRRSCVS